MSILTMKWLNRVKLMRLNNVLTLVCSHLRNTFEADNAQGVFFISDGKITPSDAFQCGDWVGIIGSRRNNGIYKLQACNNGSDFLLTNGMDDTSISTDESFSGSVFRLDFPPLLIKLAHEIETWMNDPANEPSNIVSEKVSGFHSWSKATNQDGTVAGWETVFSDRFMEHWRRMWQTDTSIQILGG